MPQPDKEQNNVISVKDFLKDERHYQTNENFLLREIGGEYVLVPVGDAGIYDNTMITLNETCAYLWKLFQEPKRVQEAVDRVLEDYSGAEDEEITRDICYFVLDSLQKGFLKETKANV